MRKTRMFQVGAAVLLAALVGFINYQWMTRPSARAAPANAAQAMPLLPVMVAARDLPAGARLIPESVRVARYLQESAPATTFRKPQDLEGRVLRNPVLSGEPLLDSDLAPAEVTVGGIQSRITPGKRAMAVRGNEVLGISGFVAPGDRIDVLVTMARDGKGGGETATKLVLESVPVLATGTALEPSADGTGTSPVDVYTLEVTPEEGEILALASTQGTLHFAMRNLEDRQTIRTRGADVRTALSSLSPEAPPAPKAGRPARAAKLVEIIKGGQRSSMSF
jgi:pilus assembly protein CpaB